MARQLARIAERNRALEQERLSRQTRVTRPTEEQMRALQSQQQQAAQVIQKKASQPNLLLQLKPVAAQREIPDYVPKPVPLNQVPDAMKAALEKYQTMLKKQG